jgi:hypothetical protein
MDITKEIEMDRSKIAKKAVRTRKARKQFMDKFGRNTYRILSCLANDMNPWWAGKMQVAAVKAHLTMGTYAPFVKRTRNGISGSCKL